MTAPCNISMFKCDCYSLATSSCQIFNEFNARKPDEKNIFRGVTKNGFFMGIIAVTILLQVKILQKLFKYLRPSASLNLFYLCVEQHCCSYFGRS